MWPLLGLHLWPSCLGPLRVKITGYVIIHAWWTDNSLWSRISFCFLRKWILISFCYKSRSAKPGSNTRDSAFGAGSRLYKRKECNVRGKSSIFARDTLWSFSLLVSRLPHLHEDSETNIPERSLHLSDTMPVNVLLVVFHRKCWCMALQG